MALVGVSGSSTTTRASRSPIKAGRMNISSNPAFSKSVAQRPNLSFGNSYTVDKVNSRIKWLGWGRKLRIRRQATGIDGRHLGRGQRGLARRFDRVESLT